MPNGPTKFLKGRIEGKLTSPPAKKGNGKITHLDHRCHISGLGLFGVRVERPYADPSDRGRGQERL